VRTLKTTTLVADTEEIVALDGASYEYVTKWIVSSEIETIAGSIAAYNRNSCTGRFFDPTLRRTIPFKPDKEAVIGDRTPLTWSLDERERGREGMINIRARRLITSRDVTKAYLLRGCSLPSRT
jgi:hypothetical protein